MATDEDGALQPSRYPPGYEPTGDRRDIVAEFHEKIARLCGYYMSEHDLGQAEVIGTLTLIAGCYSWVWAETTCAVPDRYKQPPGDSDQGER